MTAAPATERMLTRAALLAQTRARLREAGLASPDLDARVLVTGVLGIDAKELIVDPHRGVPEADQERLEAAILRRLAGEPVYRILGARPFFGLDLKLSAATLEPRPDTEILVEAVLPHVTRIAAQKGVCRIVDMGTGSGAICLALLSLCPEARAVGVDLSPEALRTAAANAERLGLSERFEPLESDWFQSVAGLYDVIVSNPPYIPSGDIPTLAREVREHDPHLALDGGQDGLEFYRLLASGAKAYLGKAGIVAVEHGHDQRTAVGEIFEGFGFSVVSFHDDLSGHARVAVFAAGRASERAGDHEDQRSVGPFRNTGKKGLGIVRKAS